VEVEGDMLTVQLRLDLVFDFAGGNQDATKVAGDAASLAAPEA
jgi:hypothetical protein